MQKQSEGRSPLLLLAGQSQQVLHVNWHGIKLHIRAILRM